MQPRYVLISPARNEGEFLPVVIQSIVKQTIRPVRWVIVSDNSTDDTESIVAAAAERHSFIKLAINTSPDGRSFGSKAAAFRRGLELVADVDFDFIGNLDADITLEPDYYARMIAELMRDSKIGVAGGIVWDKTPNGFRRTHCNSDHAVGAVQFWRRACFESVGGYRPATVGGVDSIAELTARMKGWKTRGYSDVPVYHHKPVDSALGKNAVRIAYRAGQTDYHIGAHPLFAFGKALSRWRTRPMVWSSLVRIYGYASLWARSAPRDASTELVSYLKREQLQIIGRFLTFRRTRRLSAPSAGMNPTGR